MIAVVQRVAEASVTINSTLRSKIGAGLLILLGIEINDTELDAQYIVQKISRLRIFSDIDGKMNLSVQDINGEVLLVSQFTLLASTQKGNRPSFEKAAKPEIALPLYEYCVTQLQLELGKPIATGSFGADMKVRLLNDGPVTVLLNSKKE